MMNLQPQRPMKLVGLLGIEQIMLIHHQCKLFREEARDNRKRVDLHRLTTRSIPFILKVTARKRMTMIASRIEIRLPLKLSEMIPIGLVIWTWILMSNSKPGDSRPVPITPTRPLTTKKTTLFLGWRTWIPRTLRLSLWSMITFVLLGEKTWRSWKEGNQPTTWPTKCWLKSSIIICRPSWVSFLVRLRHKMRYKGMKLKE